MATIQAGIARAQATGTDVYVANRDQFRAAVYAENVDMAPGVSVIGRFYSTDGGFGYPSAAFTELLSQRYEGVRFGPGMGRETRLMGFVVHSTGGDAGTAITILSSSPTLEDIVAGYPQLSSDRSVGAFVDRLDGGAIPSPRFVDSTFYAVSGTAEATGLWVRNGRVEMEGGAVAGGMIGEGGAATAVRLESSLGSTFFNVALTGCVGKLSGLTNGFCRAVYTTGDVSGSVFGGCPVVGCQDGCPSVGEDVAFDIQWCGGAWDGGAPMVVGASSIYGAAGDSLNGIARGFRIGEGCAVTIRDNGIVGASTAANNPNGIRCTKGFGGTYGARCVIERNSIISHVTGAAPTAAAVLCDQGCDAIVQNDVEVLGTGTSSFHAIHVNGGAPLIARNKLNLNQTDTGCSQSRGLELVNSAARVENNFIRGGGCQNSVALVHVQTVAGPGAFVHSNSLVSGDTAISFAVYALGGQTGGRYINNILSTGLSSGGTTRASIGFDGITLPLELTANLLHSVSPGAHVVTQWNTAPQFYSAATANAQLTWAKQNISAADPGFRSWRNLHLLSTSPAIDAGTGALGPVNDVDGDPRPAPDAGYSPAIGADEPL